VVVAELGMIMLIVVVCVSVVSLGGGLARSPAPGPCDHLDGAPLGTSPARARRSCAGHCSRRPSPHRGAPRPTTATTTPSPSGWAANAGAGRPPTGPGVAGWPDAARPADLVGRAAPVALQSSCPSECGQQAGMVPAPGASARVTAAGSRRGRLWSPAAVVAFVVVVWCGVVCFHHLSSGNIRRIMASSSRSVLIGSVGVSGSGLGSR
jgi:hypothetical protein